jgi:hypothetical protein
VDDVHLLSQPRMNCDRETWCPCGDIFADMRRVIVDFGRFV